MSEFCIVTRDGGLEVVRSYVCDAGRVVGERVDGGRVEVEFDRVDFEATFVRNAGVELTPDPPPAKSVTVGLELISQQLRDVADFSVVEGVVRNVLDQDLDNVVVRAIGRDGGGAFLTSEEALIDRNSLGPGAESTFRVILRGETRVRTAKIQFRTLLGGELTVRELGDGDPGA